MLKEDGKRDFSKLLSSVEYKKLYQSDIDIFNEYINKTKIIVNMIDRFIVRGRNSNFDIDVFYNRIIIDAKSILGLLSLDLTKTLTVKCYGEDEDFNRVLSKYAAG